MYSKAPLWAVAAMTVLGCQKKQTRDEQPKEAAAKPERDETSAPDDTEAEARLTRWGFDDAEPGTIPAGLRLAETNGVGKPATWAVVDDPTAPSPPRAFGVTKATNDGQFNLAIVSAGPAYADVDIHVMLRAKNGERDQGGGLMYRVAGPDEYYVARWNPLENNARFYVVQDGVRSELAEVELQLDPEAWHAMRVLVEGRRMELLMDEQSVLTIEDEKLTKAGKIGLWTKTDAATLFDDLTVSPL